MPGGSGRCLAALTGLRGDGCLLAWSWALEWPGLNFHPGMGALNLGTIMDNSGARLCAAKIGRRTPHLPACREACG